MASHANPPLRYRANVFLSEPQYFKRKVKKSKPNKVQRRIKLKFRHILGSFILIFGLFLSIQKVYLFLISWEKLTVNHIELSCKRDRIAEDIRQFLKGKHLGNLMTLDIHAFKEELAIHPWIKEVRVRKAFPSTLKIAILERQPFAVMNGDPLFLIDGEGIKLQEIDSVDNWSLPLLVDANDFKQDSEGKIALAWAFLQSLDPSMRESVDTVDLTEYENVKVRFKESQTWLVLGEDQFYEKMKLYFAQTSFLNQFGPLEYVDLRFEERIYIKPQNLFAKDFSSSITKEAK